MERVQMKTKSAVVCYCLMGAKNNSEKVSGLLGWCQETFENAGYREVSQGFAVGRKIPVAMDFCKYPFGFRAQVDESEYNSSYVENLVLSYGLLSSAISSPEFVHRQETTDYYLVLLMTDEKYNRDKVFPIIKVFEKLKEQCNLSVCALLVNGKSYYDAGDTFGDFIECNNKEALGFQLLCTNEGM